jgi:2-polyprenyl-6-methoxyphenol hydroxylase-like FAD-dependent oxidoreductase
VEQEDPQSETRRPSTAADVLIVGGGPTGLFLACELRLAGVPVVVLERSLEPDQTDKAHGMIGLSVRVLDNRGLLERLGSQGPPAAAPVFFYAGMPLRLSLLGAGNPVTLLQVNQRQLEHMLEARARELGASIRRGCDLTGFSQSEDGVEAAVRDADGSNLTLSARYLVGCDGGNSIVRRQAGIGFPGTTDEHTVDRSAMIAPSGNFRFLPGNRVWIEGVGEIPAMFHRTDRGVFNLLPHDPQHPLINTAEWEQAPAGAYPGPGEPLTIAEIEASVARVLGVRVPLDPPGEGEPTLWRRLTHRNSRQADRYRAGRVFIAGDAAHVSHGPTLNAAINDAANLGWKLAAAVQGWAPDGLLDTYESERHPAGQRVLMHTQAESALLGPGADVTALREVFAEMTERADIVAMIAATMSGADVRYASAEPSPSGRVGWFAPDIELSLPDARPARTAELLHSGRPTLLDLKGAGQLAAIARPWAGRVDVVQATPGEPSTPSVLIRPDGYVAWDDSGNQALESALTQWFGPPLPHA